MPTSTGYWLTRPEVGERLKVPVKTLAQWASQGKGPRFAKIGRWTRYRLEDVMAWEDAQFGAEMS
jgi:Helix-turn-helix domain